MQHEPWWSSPFFDRTDLQDRQLNDLEGLTFSVPNASLDTSGFMKGVANFQVRGLGTVGSDPTIEPMVGLYLDGVYVASNLGAVLDAFDVEAVEVRRGPQGITYGRNLAAGRC